VVNNPLAVTDPSGLFLDARPCGYDQYGNPVFVCGDDDLDNGQNGICYGCGPMSAGGGGGGGAD
jgi:hypothetical protein